MQVEGVHQLLHDAKNFAHGVLVFLEDAVEFNQLRARVGVVYRSQAQAFVAAQQATE